MIRRTIAWLTWSPRRALTAAAVLGLVLSVLGVVQLLRGAETLNRAAGRVSVGVPNLQPATTPTASTTSPTPTGAGTLTGRDDLDALPRSEQQRSDQLADTFIRVWLSGPTAPSTAAWLQPLDGQIAGALRPYLEASRLAIPKARVVSTTRTAATAGSAATTYRLSNGDRVLVELTHNGQRWLVSSYRPVA